MKTFYRCTNQGVTAVVDEETWLLVERWKHRVDHPEQGKTGRLRRYDPDLCPGPLFTFAAQPTYHHRIEFLTGNLSLMDRLLNGHHVEQREFYVPFSNGFQWVGDELGRLERGYRTTLDQAMRVFELATPAEVRVKLDGATREFQRFALGR